MPICDACVVLPPADALRRRGIAAEFQWKFLRFIASLHIPGVSDDASFSARPEWWTTAVTKLWVAEMELGDDIFDDNIFLKRASATVEPLLSDEGVQSSLLGLLTGNRAELVPNHVTLDGGTLTISVRPLVPMGEDGFLERQLEAAALALQIQRYLTSS